LEGFSLSELSEALLDFSDESAFFYFSSFFDTSVFSVRSVFSVFSVFSVSLSDCFSDCFLDFFSDCFSDCFSDYFSDSLFTSDAVGAGVFVLFFFFLSS